MEGTMLIHDLIKVIKKYLWIILLCTLAGAIIGKMTVPAGPEPTYRTSALVLIEKKKQEAGIVVNTSDEMGRFLNTAQTLIETPVILENVKKDLKLKESSAELAEIISVANENNSQIIRITAELTDPEKVTNIVNSTALNYSETVSQYIEDAGTVKIVQNAKLGNEAKILHTRSNANVTMGGILGLVFGGLLAFALNIKSNRKKAEK